MSQNHIFSLLRNRILHLRHKTLRSMFLALSFFFCLTAFTNIVLILLKIQHFYFSQSAVMSYSFKGFHKDLAGQYCAEELYWLEWSKDESCYHSSRFEKELSADDDSVTLVSSKQDMFETTATVSLLAVPVGRSGWIKWEGKQRLKDSIIYTFFPLFYHLSRSTCFPLGKFKLFILTSSYNLLSKGFYFGLWKLLFFLPFSGINIVWLGKKKENKKSLQLQENRVISDFTAVNYLSFTCGNTSKGKIQKQEWNTNS